MSFITLEDINTWLLKYGELDAPRYSMPHVSVDGVLYKGNVNVLGDVLSLPSGVDFTVYYMNRPVTEISLPEDYSEDSISLRVVTRSYYPYVDSDVTLSVPVEVKHLTSLEDLNKYSYGYIDTLSNISGVVSNDISIVLEDGAVLSDCNLTFKSAASFSGDLRLDNTFIINDGSLTFDNVNFTNSDDGVDYLLLNNEDLIINESTISSSSPLVLNKDTLILTGNTVNVLSTSVPFIYTNSSDYTITGNTINYTGSVEYTDFGVCFIRANDINSDKLIRENTFLYDNISVVIDQDSYVLNGHGLCYAVIDNDNLVVKELELISDV